jgi:hypothetical protein
MDFLQVPANLPAWDSISEFSSLEAAFLWFGYEPQPWNEFSVPPLVREKSEEIAKSLCLCPPTNSNLETQKVMGRDEDLRTKVSRQELARYAESCGEFPLFLFPGQRTAQASRAPRPISPIRPTAATPVRIARRPEQADWNFWQQMIEVELWKAVMLSLDIDPRARDATLSSDTPPEGIAMYAGGITWVDAEYDDALRVGGKKLSERMEIAQSHLSHDLRSTESNVARSESSDVSLASFAVWALTMGWEIPAQLAQMANMADEKSKRNAPNDTLSTKERHSLLKLVIGMAIVGYKFDPKAQRNQATADIASDLERLGIPLDPDTVRAYLREAAELLEMLPTKK